MSYFTDAVPLFHTINALDDFFQPSIFYFTTKLAHSLSATFIFISAFFGTSPITLKILLIILLLMFLLCLNSM